MRHSSASQVRKGFLLALAVLLGCNVPSKTALTSSSNPSLFGTMLLLRAKVEPSPGRPVNFSLGTVTFYDGTTGLATKGVDAAGLASYSTDALSSGSHQLTAVFSGNTYVAGSTSSAVDQLVRKADPQVSLTSSSDPSLVSNPVTFTAMIAGPAGSAVRGTVVFQDGPNFIGTGSGPDSAGVSTITANSLSIGTHIIRATFSGNGNFNSGSATLPQETFPSTTTVPTDNSGGIASALAAGRFAVSADGAATFTYPIWVPQGRRGIEPSLAVTYNSQRENELVGVGWTLEGLSSVGRCKRDMARDGLNATIQYADTDAYCLDGERLVTYPSLNSQPVLQCGSGSVIEYRTEEDRFIRILSGPSDGGGLGPAWFEADAKDGRIFCYGTTPDSRLQGQRIHNVPTSLTDNTSTAITTDLTETVRLGWALAEVRDRFGNNMTIQYCPNRTDPNCPAPGDPGNGVGYEQLPDTIRYTGTLNGSLTPQRTVAFQYQDRCDATKNCDRPTHFVSGLMLQLRHRLSQIVLSAPNPMTTSVVKTYNFSYSQSIARRTVLTGRSLLSAIIECDAANVCTNPTSFRYSQGTVPDGFVDVDTGIHDDTASGETTPSVGNLLGPIIVGDFNGDGCDDFIYTAYTTPDFNGIQSLQRAVYRLSACYDAIASGSPPFPWNNPGEWFYQLSPPHPNSGPNDKVPISMFPPRSSLCLSEFSFYNCNFDSLFAIDMDLDGRADLVRYEGISGLQYTNNTQQVQTSTLVSVASSLPPASWSPYKPLFDNLSTWQTQDTVAWCVGSFPNSFCPSYESTVAGDINGDGFPDLISILPLVWSYRLNHGRTLTSASGSNCGSYGEACLNLDPRSMLFAGYEPTVHTCNGNTTGGFTWVPAVDIDGDGTTEVLLRDPAGPNWYGAFSLDALNNLRPLLNLALPGGEAFCPFRREWFADVNGDGLPDAISVEVGGGNPFVSLNTGNGFGAPAKVTVDVAPPSDTMLLFDYDGNGAQDLIYPGSSGLRALLGVANQPLGTASLTSIPLNAMDPTFNLTPIPVGQSLQAFDANGDGLADLIQVVNGDIHVYLRQGQKRDLLVEVNDRGAPTLILYAPMSSASVYSTTVAPGVVSAPLGPSLPPMLFPATQTYVTNRGPWVVSKYSVPRAGNLGSPDPANTYTFTYQDGRTSLLGRGWLGFRKLTATDAQTGVVTETIYDNQTTVGSAYPYARREAKRTVSVQLGDSGLFHQNVSAMNYQTQGTTNPFTGTPDGRYIVVTPTSGSQKEYEGASEIRVDFALDPPGDPGSFSVQIDGLSYATATVSGTTGPQVVAPGAHTVTAAANPGTTAANYLFLIGGDCAQSGNQGNLTTAAGDVKRCSLTIVSQEQVVCSVFDDGYTNMEGPSGAVFISGRKTNNERGKACIPGGQFGHCHKWFGRCFTANNNVPVYFKVFDDGYTNIAGPSDSIFITPGNGKACVPDGTTRGACRKWFGRALSNDGRTVSCAVFDDGSANITAVSDAIFIPNPIPGPGQACIPNSANGDCRRWFGECTTLTLSPP